MVCFEPPACGRTLAMKRVRFIFMASCFAASLGGATAGCGDDDQSVNVDSTDTDGLEVAFPDGINPGDDTTVLFDSTTPTDTSAADTEKIDTVVEDSSVEDTDEPADTTVEDTDVPADTTVEDTTVADTTLEDTTAADTTVADTTVADTTIPGCQSGGCTTNIAKGGTSCSSAYIIGRPNADDGNGSSFGHAASTVGAGNNSDFAQAVCGDDRNDRFYQIYLKVGEQLTVTLNPTTTGFDASLSLYAGVACDTGLTCVDNDLNQTTPDRLLWQARDMPGEGDGWYTIVVDGRNTSGDYSVVVQLDCQEEDCCCQ
ncbi:MAG: hypothetical protein ACI9MR_002622 [Myxococcota bacterium]|jgi:hypothetical protein